MMNDNEIAKNWDLTSSETADLKALGFWDESEDDIEYTSLVATVRPPAGEHVEFLSLAALVEATMCPVQRATRSSLVVDALPPSGHGSASATIRVHA